MPRSSEPADDPPNVENPEERARAIDAIAEDYLDRLIDGDRPDRAAVVRSHSELGDDLDRRLALMDLLFGARPPR